ncbi:hypothetical protein CC78DRAFT_579651 [Lojkania enalia]|uniref:Uncharacterized protein n=1 Tax=Lojkania enalia TaxID=147567 RepID=A0A9P4N8K3_9PLEO|nr:hypothetical protein CC78DRAFT_579651 [Didymosphaeria enalia]
MAHLYSSMSAESPQVGQWVQQKSNYQNPEYLPPQVGQYVQPNSNYSTPTYLTAPVRSDVHNSGVNSYKAATSLEGQRLQPKKHSNQTKPLPPTSIVEDPFGGPKTPDRVDNPGSDIAVADQGLRPQYAGLGSNIWMPTCSLNLVCYSRGCTIRQIRATSRKHFRTDEEFNDAIANTPSLITTDRKLFETLREKYQKDMSGFWRHYFSLKTLRRLRLLSYTENTRPKPVPLDEITMQEVLYAYKHAAEFGNETDWIEWIFRLRRPDERHALEFVEGWNGPRIAVVGTIPCIASMLVGVIWTARGGDAQTAFTVATFILTVTTEHTLFNPAVLLPRVPSFGTAQTCYSRRTIPTLRIEKKGLMPFRENGHQSAAITKEGSSESRPCSTMSVSQMEDRLGEVGKRSLKVEDIHSSDIRSVIGED